MADNDMLKAAQAEVRRLEEELAKTAAYQRLQLARQVVELYSKEVSEAPRPAESIPGKQTKLAQIENASAEFLRRRKKRATSGEITKELEAQGIHLPGKKPAKSLSAYLSRSEKFNNDPEAGGYGLAEWNSTTTKSKDASNGGGQLPLAS